MKHPLQYLRTLTTTDNQPESATHLQSAVDSLQASIPQQACGNKTTQSTRMMECTLLIPQSARVRKPPRNDFHMA